MREPSSAPLIEKLAAKKDLYLKAADEAVRQRYSVTLERFDSGYLSELELGKAMIRAIYRYDSDAWELARSVTREVSSTVTDGARKLYCTLPYPMIHLPHDQSEKGEIHCDGYSKGFFTIWVPLNECKTQNLTLYPKSQRRLGQLVFTLAHKKVRVPYERLFPSVSPGLDLGDYLTWDGKLRHIGNLNRTPFSTVALVVRMTDRPILFEPTSVVGDLGDSCQDVSDPFAFCRSFIRLFDEIKLLEECTKRDGLSIRQVASETRRKIDSLDMSRFDRKRISFALTMYTQRMNTVTDCTWIDLFSMLSERDHMQSLSRFTRSAARHWPQKEIRAFFSDYMGTHGSLQASTQLRDIVDEDVLTEDLMAWSG